LIEAIGTVSVAADTVFFLGHPKLEFPGIMAQLVIGLLDKRLNRFTKTMANLLIVGDYNLPDLSFRSH
jgi:hypothetical protein